MKQQEDACYEKSQTPAEKYPPIVPHKLLSTYELARFLLNATIPSPSTKELYVEPL